MKRYFFIGVAILTLGILINYSLGGFATVEPYLIEVKGYTIYGTEYKGSYKGDKLGVLINELKILQPLLEVDTDVTIINYIDKEQETIGNITNFVGLQLNENVGTTSGLENLEKRTIAATKAVRLNVKVKPLVMPSPEKIKKIAFEYASKEGLQLQQYSIERYSSDGILIIEFPIID